MRYKIGKFSGLLASLVLAMTPAAAVEPYRPALVIAAMKNVNPRLKIVVSHRGAYADYCPENSTCAIDRAAQNNVEAVEIDVKETRDGILWPSHDITIGRGTNYSVTGPLFDPFKRDKWNSFNNPYIANMLATDMRNLKLRDMSGRVTSLNAISLFDLMKYTRDRHPNTLVILDIKYSTSVRKAAEMIRELGMSNQIVMKFSIDFFSPTDVRSHTLNYYFAPTIYAGSLDNIAETRNLNRPTYSERVFEYAYAYRSVPGFVYFEVGNKMFYSIGSSMGVEGPLSNLTWRLAAARVPIGNFNPVIEHVGNATHPETGFYHTDGQCCTRLIDFLTTTKHFGRETRDDRPNLEWQLKFNESVISDNAVEARSLAQRLGFRQDEYTLVR